MKVFETGYTNHRSTIVMRADLINGFSEQEGQFVFDRWGFLPYKGETKFKCRLRFSADWSAKNLARESLFAIDERFSDLRAHHSETRCDVKVANGILEVACPLTSQNFQPSKTTKSRNLVSYFYIPDFRFMRHTAKEIRSAIESKSALPSIPLFLFEYWLSVHGPASMFVKDQYEKFERGVISGGRPESNRRKF